MSKNQLAPEEQETGIPTIEAEAEAIERALSADDLLTDLAAPSVTTVHLPAFGRYVKLRAMSLEEAQRVRNDHVSTVGGVATFDSVGFYKEIARLTLVEPRLTAAQVNLLWTKAADAVSPLVMAIDEINGIGKEAQKEAEAEFRQV